VTSANLKFYLAKRKEGREKGLRRLKQGRAKFGMLSAKA
jgi:hypothetical protein